jgi:sodium-dependent phosphate cotransporter
MNESTEDPSQPRAESRSGNAVCQWLGVVTLVYLLVVAVGAIQVGFQTAAGDRVEALFAFATNPFMGLLVGTVTTAILQSSSTVTSTVVALVAAGLPVAAAIPIVMGANIGTTITNTLVSLAHVGDRQEFRRAFAAATVHDCFNLLCVLLFLPLEIAFHPLEKIGLYFASLAVGNGSVNLERFNAVNAATEPAIQAIAKATALVPFPWGGILLVALGVGTIFGVILSLGRLLKGLLVGRARTILFAAVGRGSLAGIVSGAIVTALVQSSSTTTSLMVPLAGMGIFELTEIYPFTLGANIGTCVTALLAATGVGGVEALPALEIALVHLLFNTLGVVTIYGLPLLRPIPIWGAETLATVAAERKSLAIAHIVGTFFLIPGLLLGITARLTLH